MTKDVLKKYLDYSDLQVSYCEPEVEALENFSARFNQGLVIPMYKEGSEALERFCTFAENQSDTLLIIVLNQPDDNNDISWANDFIKSTRLNNRNSIWSSKKHDLNLFSLNNNSALLLVDRCIKGSAIPSKQGVGLARKIGADLLSSLIFQKKVSSPWIANTDADAILPKDYFSSLDDINRNAATSAVIFPYKHIFNDNTPHLPTLLYEFTLFYYVAGLSFANSPYAYHTLGSTICCHYQHYAKVRGFPKRAAAEDFYLLNKLAKTGSILSLNNPTVDLQARESNRVPFGTGPAVIRLTEENKPSEMSLYHPDSFVYLRFLLQLFPIVTTLKVNTASEAKKLLSNTVKENYSCINLTVLLAICEEIKLEEAIHHCHQHGKTPQTRLQQLQQWFDGFKTLKFIHLLRDQYLNTVPFSQWINNADKFDFLTNEKLNLLLSTIKGHLKN